MKRITTILTGLLTSFSLSANSLADDNALEMQAVAENVYALVGKRGPMDENDLGTNATFGVIVTHDGVALIDPGASFKGAQRIHAAIRSITDKPERLVIDTGGEDHRWLGNGYFKQQGTQAVYTDETFATETELVLGDTTLHLMHTGPAYTPGDTLVWLPKERIAALKPARIVPGHGHAATLDYLLALRKGVEELMDNGGTLSEVSRVDQSRFKKLIGYEMLKGRNAHQVFQEMEWQ